MRSLVVLGGVLVAGASVFGLWQLKDKQPKVAGFKAEMPNTGSMEKNTVNSQVQGLITNARQTNTPPVKSEPATINSAGMAAPLSLADTQKQNLIAALGGKQKETTPVQAKNQAKGWWQAQNKPVTGEQKAQNKLVSRILDKATSGVQKGQGEVKKTITYRTAARLQQASVDRSTMMKKTAKMAAPAVAPVAAARDLAKPAKKPAPQLAMLNKAERSALGELVEAKKIPSINVVIEFAYKSARLSDVSLPALTRIGEALTDGQLADATFVIAGHTDSVGGSKYNLGLSAQRAQTVRNFLKFRYKISDERLVAVGYGEERLKNTGEPEAAENRRVEFISLIR